MVDKNKDYEYRLRREKEIEIKNKMPKKSKKKKKDRSSVEFLSDTAKGVYKSFDPDKFWKSAGEWADRTEELVRSGLDPTSGKQIEKSIPQLLGESLARVGMNSASIMSLRQLEHIPEFRDLISRSSKGEQIAGEVLGYVIEGFGVGYLTKKAISKFIPQGLRLAKKSHKVIKVLQKKGKMPTELTTVQRRRVLEEVARKASTKAHRRTSLGEGTFNVLTDTTRNIMRDVEEPLETWGNLLGFAIPPALNIATGSGAGLKRAFAKQMSGLDDPEIDTITRLSRDKNTAAEITDLGNYAEGGARNEYIAQNFYNKTKSTLKKFNSEVGAMEAQADGIIKTKYKDLTFDVAEEFSEKMENFKDRFTGPNHGAMRKTQKLQDKLNESVKKYDEFSSEGFIEKKYKDFIKTQKNADGTVRDFTPEEAAKVKEDITKEVGKDLGNMKVEHQKLQEAMLESEKTHYVWLKDQFGEKPEKMYNAAMFLKERYLPDGRVLDVSDMTDVKNALNDMGKFTEEMASADPHLRKIYREFSEIGGFIKDRLYKEVPEAEKLNAIFAWKARNVRPIEEVMMDSAKSKKWIDEIPKGFDPKLDVMRAISDPQWKHKMDTIWDQTSKYGAQNQFDDIVRDYDDWQGSATHLLEANNLINTGKARQMTNRLTQAGMRMQTGLFRGGLTFGGASAMGLPPAVSGIFASASAATSLPVARWLSKFISKPGALARLGSTEFQQGLSEALGHSMFASGKKLTKAALRRGAQRFMLSEETRLKTTATEGDIPGPTAWSNDTAEAVNRISEATGQRDYEFAGDFARRPHAKARMNSPEFISKVNRLARVVQYQDVETARRAVKGFFDEENSKLPQVTQVGDPMFKDTSGSFGRQEAIRELAQVGKPKKQLIPEEEKAAREEIDALFMGSQLGEGTWEKSVQAPPLEEQIVKPWEDEQEPQF